MAKTSGQLEQERIRQRNLIVINDLSVCYHCKTKGLTEIDNFCPACGFPQRGSQNEQQSFVLKFRGKRTLLEERKKAVKRCGAILFALAGLNFLIAIISGLVIADDLPVFISQLIVGLIYLGLGFWGRVKPYPAILTGLFVYITFLCLNAFFDPASIFAGLLWKVAIISALVYGYKSVRVAEKLQSELDFIKKARESNG